MIETALLMPLVFLLILMVIEMGFLLWTNLNVKQAAREAARFASVGKRVGDRPGDPTCSTAAGANTISGRAYAAAVGRISCPEVSVVYVGQPGSTKVIRGDSVIVKIDHRYESLTGFLRLINVTSPVIHACADARVESPPDAADAAAHPPPLPPAKAGCV